MARTLFLRQLGRRSRLTHRDSRSFIYSRQQHECCCPTENRFAASISIDSSPDSKRNSKGSHKQSTIGKRPWFPLAAHQDTLHGHAIQTRNVRELIRCSSATSRGLLRTTKSDKERNYGDICICTACRLTCTPIRESE